jgi:hypothetical protein
MAGNVKLWNDLRGWASFDWMRFMRKSKQPETPDCCARVHRTSAWQVQGILYWTNSPLCSVPTIDSKTADEDEEGEIEDPESAAISSSAIPMPA